MTNNSRSVGDRQTPDRQLAGQTWGDVIMPVTGLVVNSLQLGAASTEFVLGGRSTGISFEKSSLAFLRMETQIDLRLDSGYRERESEEVGRVDSANAG